MYSRTEMRRRITLQLFRRIAGQQKTNKQKTNSSRKLRRATCTGDGWEPFRSNAEARCCGWRRDPIAGCPSKRGDEDAGDPPATEGPTPPPPLDDPQCFQKELLSSGSTSTLQITRDDERNGTFFSSIWRYVYPRITALKVLPDCGHLKPGHSFFFFFKYFSVQKIDQREWKKYSYSDSGNLICEALLASVSPGLRLHSEGGGLRIWGGGGAT